MRVLAHINLCMQLVWPVCVHACVVLYSLGQQTLLSVCSPWVYGTGGSFMWPRLGEGLSGQGAWSQGSHTAAHCPELRAASQRRGGLVFLPQLWESVSRPGGGSPKWPPRERQDLCPRWCFCGQQRSPVGGKIVLTATQSGATPKRAEVFREFADCIALNNCQGKTWVKTVFYFFCIQCIILDYRINNMILYVSTLEKKTKKQLSKGCEAGSSQHKFFWFIPSMDYDTFF